MCTLSKSTIFSYKLTRLGGARSCCRPLRPKDAMTACLLLAAWAPVHRLYIFRISHIKGSTLGKQERRKKPQKSALPERWEGVRQRRQSADADPGSLFTGCCVAAAQGSTGCLHQRGRAGIVVVAVLSWVAWASSSSLSPPIEDEARVWRRRAPVRADYRSWHLTQFSSSSRATIVSELHLLHPATYLQRCCCQKL